MRLLQADEVPLAAFVVVVTLEISKARGRARAGHSVAEASMAHQAELPVRLLQADEVPLAALAAVVTPEASTAVAASGVHTEEVMEGEVEEATGKLKE